VQAEFELKQNSLVISHYLSSISAGLKSLVFDSSCIICGFGKLEFCVTCQEQWRSNPRQITGESFKVFSSISYNDVARSVVLAAKENSLSTARKLIIQEIKLNIERLCLSETKPPREVLLVPIPSSARAKRRRGGDFIFEISRASSAELNREHDGLCFASRSLLKMNRKILDQTKLTQSQREINLSGAFKVAQDFFTVTPIIIIDDVVTTGSTLREAVRALKERNLTVLGAATACASQRRFPIRSPLTIGLY
jgi:predicted amidophosphoribosyltransferase